MLRAPGCYDQWLAVFRAENDVVVQRKVSTGMTIAPLQTQPSRSLDLREDFLVIPPAPLGRGLL